MIKIEKEKRRRKIKKKLVVLLAAVIVTSMLAGCSSGSSSDSTTSTSTESEQSTDLGTDSGSDTTEVKTVRVVTSSTYEPYCYVDENGDITGFDVDVLKAIDEASPELQMTFEYAAWDAMLPGLDSDRYDLVVYELSKNEDRESMYHFGQYPYTVSDGDTIITIPEHAGWQNLDDAAATGGVVLAGIIGSSFTEELEEYLTEHPDAFTIQYYETEIDAVIEDLANGRIDGFVNDPNVTMEKVKKAGYEDKIVVAGSISEGSASWFIYRQNDTGSELSDIIDQYLKQLYEDGTLSELANQWFGNDNCIQRLETGGYFANERGV